MNNIVSLNAAKSAAQPVTEAYKTGGYYSGATDMRLTTQWARRPNDQKFLSLGEMHKARKAEAEASRSMTVDTKKIAVAKDEDSETGLKVAFEDENGNKHSMHPTNYSFGQTCGLVKAPASYIGRLPAKLAAINLQYGLQSHRAELVKAFWNEETNELKALTGPEYGRIYDHEIIDELMKFAGNGDGDTCWKVPGRLEGGKYNPFVDVTKDTTTLYASDRDCFLFLADDTRPIEIGKLPDGSPDVVFRGFGVSNSEVGNGALNIFSWLLRGICANRILWGVQEFEQVSIRHSKFAPSRWGEEIAPAIQAYAEASEEGVLMGINAARDAIVANNRKSGQAFLKGQGFAAKKANEILDAILNEEGKEAESVWDFVQGITAVARQEQNADKRVELEKTAGKLMKYAA